MPRLKVWPSGVAVDVDAVGAGLLELLIILAEQVARLELQFGAGAEQRHFLAQHEIEPDRRDAR